MSAKNFTLEEALARIEALEKRSFGWHEEIIFEGDAQADGFTLTKPYTDFDYLIIDSTLDQRTHDMFTWVACKYVALNQIIVLRAGNGYWSGKFTSTTFFSSPNEWEDCAIKRVIGVKMSNTNKSYYDLLDDIRSSMWEVAA